MFLIRVVQRPGSAALPVVSAVLPVSAPALQTHCQETIYFMKISRVFACCAAMALVTGLALAGQKEKKGDPEKGKEVFQQCAVCHNADSTEKKMGPGLKGLFSREKMNNGKKPTDATVREKIDEGGNGMPAYKEMLSDDEKDDLIAYLKTL